MTLLDFCRKIQLDDAATNIVCSFTVSDNEVAELRELFYRDTEAFYDCINAKPQSAQWYLVLYVRFAVLLEEEYAIKHIPEAIYTDTFSDIAIWEKECFEQTGKHGLLEIQWLSKHLKLEVFRLGRLQFEPISFPPELAQAIDPPDEKVLNVHIPKGAPLKEQVIADSYGQAMDFWGLKQAVFVCHSWLISPMLKELLSPTANILTFQKDYELAMIDWECRQAEERIFGYISDDIDSYPENTGLQKSAKAWLISGKKIPAGWGVFRYK
jgi:hypothetical protein